MTTEVFVDTSAVYAVLDADDDRHGAAASGWGRLLDRIEAGTHRGSTHHAVVVEASALVQRRLGVEALRALHDAVLPVLECGWIDGALHDRAVSALLAAGRRDVSLVDWLSFEVMRERAIGVAFAFDDDFAARGYARWA